MIIKGKAQWAHVTTPETYNGQEVGYTIQVILEPERLEKLKVALTEYFENELAYGSLKGKQINPKMEVHIPIKEDTQGNQSIKCKTKHFYIDRTTGERVNKTLPIFDAQGKQFAKGVLIGNGSDVNVNVTPRAYITNKNNFGVTLYLNGLMVKKLVEYGVPTAQSLGFEIEEGAAEEFEEVEF